MNSIDANIRKTKTKGELNSLKNKGNVPAIIYGGEAQMKKFLYLKKYLNHLLKMKIFYRVS